MWCLCMMPQTNLSLWSFQVWLPHYTVYTFRLIYAWWIFPSPHKIQHYYSPHILRRDAFWFCLPHQLWYMALAKYSQAWLCKAGCSQKKGCFQTSQKPEQHALWMLQPYQKTCYSSALTNKNATVYLQSVRRCSVSPPLLADLCKLLYLKTIPHTADPSPGYHWYFGRKADFFFILDWVGYMVQSPRWQFQNGDQPFGFKYERKVLALFTPTCLLNIFLVLWLGRIVCIFLFIPLILKI